MNGSIQIMFGFGGHSHRILNVQHSVCPGVRSNHHVTGSLYARRTLHPLLFKITKIFINILEYLFVAHYLVMRGVHDPLFGTVQKGIPRCVVVVDRRPAAFYPQGPLRIHEVFPSGELSVVDDAVLVEIHCIWVTKPAQGIALERRSENRRSTIAERNWSLKLYFKHFKRELVFIITLVCQNNRQRCQGIFRSSADDL
jgi:hypothetical protein